MTDVSMYVRRRIAHEARRTPQAEERHAHSEGTVPEEEEWQDPVDPVRKGPLLAEHHSRDPHGFLRGETRHGFEARYIVANSKAAQARMGGAEDPKHVPIGLVHAVGRSEGTKLAKLLHALRKGVPANSRCRVWVVSLVVLVHPESSQVKKCQKLQP